MMIMVSTILFRRRTKETILIPINPRSYHKNVKKIGRTITLYHKCRSNYNNYSQKQQQQQQQQKQEFFSFLQQRLFVTSSSSSNNLEGDGFDEGKNHQHTTNTRIHQNCNNNHHDPFLRYNAISTPISLPSSLSFASCSASAKSSSSIHSNNTNDFDNDTTIQQTKDILIQNIRQDLPQIREEIFTLVQEEEDEEEEKAAAEERLQEEKGEIGNGNDSNDIKKQQQQQQLDDEKLFSTSPFQGEALWRRRRKRKELEQNNSVTLRLRYENAWQQYCSTKKRNNTGATGTISSNRDWISYYKSQGWDKTNDNIEHFNDDDVDRGGCGKNTYHINNDNDLISSAAADIPTTTTTTTTTTTHDIDNDNEKKQSSSIENKEEEEVEKVCLLLERMTLRDWQFFDKEENDENNIEIFHDDHADDDDDDDDNHIVDSAYIDNNPRKTNETWISPLDDGVESELSDIDIVYELLEQSVEIPLTICEYNLLLARIATSPELSHEEIMDSLLNMYHHITKFSLPNENTYKILLLTLDRRIHAGSGGSSDGTIVTLLQDMINFEVKLSSPTLLRLGMRSIDRENNLNVAKRFVVDYTLDDPKRRFSIPNKVLRSLMKMIARENKQDLAIELLKKTIVENIETGGRAPDVVFDAAIRWPNRNRAGQQRDNTHLLQAILDLILDNRAVYKPGYSVWRNLLVALSRVAQADESRWKLLQRPFHLLFEQYSNFYPDEYLLRVGLEYCEAMKDSKMALYLIERSVERHLPSRGTKFDEVAYSPAGSAVLLENSSWEHDHEIDYYSIDDAFLLVTPGKVLVSEEDFKAAERKRSEIRSESSMSPSEMHGLENSIADPQESTHIDDVPTLEEAEYCTSTYSSVEAIPPPDELRDVSSMTLIEESRLSAAPFSIKVFRKAIKVCHEAEDMQRGRAILGALSKMSDLYPIEIQSDVWSYALNVFARCSHNDADFIKEIFESMKREEMKIGEEAYGAVMHSLAVDNRSEEVSQIFQEINLGRSEDGVVPGLSCYNALILSHLNERAWDNVMQAYEEMKVAGVAPDAITSQGLLISAYRKGGKAHVRQVIEDLLELNVLIRRQNCELALKMLLPDIVRGKQRVPVDHIQQKLRELGQTDQIFLQPLCLNLLRSFRQADIEEKRLPTHNAPNDILLKRREQAWQTALKDILDMAKALEGKDEKEPKRKVTSSST